MIRKEEYEMNLYEKLADLIFPDVHESIDDLEQRYPLRNLPDGAMVTRFAPSPTGFLHTGSLLTSLIGWKFAQQTNGIFILRLEDTDQKREVQGSGKQLVDQMKEFNVIPSEGYLSGGGYGPYAQSERKSIYRTVIKEMVRRNLAYPCFCTTQELDALRQEQEASKVVPGYYGIYARDRHLSVEEAIARIENGAPYVMRFRSQGNHEQKIVIEDLIRGRLELAENDQDIVILKSDGLPTYHFAHLVDDHFMRTTHVTRGEEWLPSLPLHLELFAQMGWAKLQYAHLPVMMKLDEGNRRKLSKRKDPEAAVSYFLEEGYPKEGFLEYLFTIANSDFEAWRATHPSDPFSNFSLTFDKFSRDGALFDMDKVKFLCKEQLAKRTSEAIVEEILTWANQYEPEFAKRIIQDKSYFTNIMAIERNQEKPRKDYACYRDVLPQISFFYEDLFELEVQRNGYPFNENFSYPIIASFLQAYHDHLSLDCDQSSWFQSVRELGEQHRFCSNVKQFKKNPEGWLGHVGDVSEMIRIAVCGRRQSPNLYDIQNVMGIALVKNRLQKSIAFLLR